MIAPLPPPPLTGERLAGLDVTRGIAVLGILTMNIVAFALPEDAYVGPLVAGGTTAADLAVWTVGFILCDSKFRALFAMLFGASAMLVMDRAGTDAPRIHRARMLTLAAAGLLHYYFIWDGDILFGYAVCGLALPLARDWPPRPLFIAGGAFVGLSAVMLGGGLLAMMAMAHGGSAAAADGLAGVRDTFGAAGVGVPADVALFTGSYAGIVHTRLIADPALPFVQLMPFGPEMLGLMLIGIGLYRTGLLAGAWPTRRLLAFALRWAAIGIAGNGALALWQWAQALDGWVVAVSSIGLSVPFDVATGIGYAAAAMALAQAGGRHWLVVRLAAAGRAAFTNYLGTSLVMTSLFYGYGLGLYGTLGRAGLLGIVVLAWALMLAWPKPWLDRYRYGPLEWLWRSAARGAWQPMRR